MKYKIGEKVKVNEKSMVYHGVTGTIVDVVDISWGTKYEVDDGSGETRWFPEDKLEKAE